MINITIKHPGRNKYYRARVSVSWADRHDNGALISCGLTVDEPNGFGTVWLTDRAFRRLEKTGAVKEISYLEWQHSGCQSSCTLRGAKKCSW